MENKNPNLDYEVIEAKAQGTIPDGQVVIQ